MAATDLTNRRAGYLHEAAHLLAFSAPSASAFLGAAKNRLIHDAGRDLTAKEQDMLRRETCGACGNLLVPAWSCQINSLPKRRTTQSRNKAQTHRLSAPTCMVYQCLRCRRQTEQELPPKPRRQLKRASANSSTQLPILTDKPLAQDDVRAPKTANASSKQRQKSRKGGLQAMLERNKTQKSAPGLDLMDFMM
ncbi:hypothetical protein ACEQ8H_001782 [Pleosporales sp. CAS-2024a]